MSREVCFKRFETDREYRWRLYAHQDVAGLLLSQAQVSHGAALDAVGDVVDCPRRIVEEMRP